MTGAVVDLRDRVGLHEVLRCVVHMLNHTGIVIQRRIAVLGPAGELKLVADGWKSSGHVLAQSYVDLIKDAVVEVELVRPDARLFKRINAERDNQVLLVAILVHERIYVGGVGRGIEHD